MSSPTRRDVLRTLIATAAAAASFDTLAAQELHQHLAEDRAQNGVASAPRAFDAHQFASLDRLTDLIIPSEAGSPGARDAAVTDWIDAMAAENQQLRGIFTAGVAWLDHAMIGRGAADFVSASDAQQRGLLDDLTTPDRAAALPDGVRFFEWARRLTVDGFYTSRVGIESLGYRGNTFVPKFEVPQDVLDLMNKRSPI